MAASESCRSANTEFRGGVTRPKSPTRGCLSSACKRPMRTAMAPDGSAATRAGGRKAREDVGSVALGQSQVSSQPVQAARS